MPLGHSAADSEPFSKSPALRSFSTAAAAAHAGRVRSCAGATATVPRMYHSVASLVASGAVITAGSNPQGSYYFQSDPATGVYPSELRVEYYYPWWLPASATPPPYLRG